MTHDLGLALEKTQQRACCETSMEVLSVLETLSLSGCLVAMLLWMSIGTFTRAPWGEAFAQRVILILCVASAIMLFAFHHLGGELFGSQNVARPFALVALIVAAAGSLNIKGTDVQGEINPHQIMRMRRDEKEGE